MKRRTFQTTPLAITSLAAFAVVESVYNTTDL